jgi:hypothetical protein
MPLPGSAGLPIHQDFAPDRAASCRRRFGPSRILCRWRRRRSNLGLYWCRQTSHRSLWGRWAQRRSLRRTTSPTVHSNSNWARWRPDPPFRGRRCQVRRRQVRRCQVPRWQVRSFRRRTCPARTPIPSSTCSSLSRLAHFPIGMKRNSRYLRPRPQRPPKRLLTSWCWPRMDLRRWSASQVRLLPCSAVRLSLLRCSARRVGLPRSSARNSFRHRRTAPAPASSHWRLSTLRHLQRRRRRSLNFANQ